ncbi:MAG: insulinase family protein, partial [Muribaculaceae bacterium]|nr:insulinase family protein [Muribaculaceae bacterium]
AIVFQEMRESRSLAYSAGAGYSGTSTPERPYTYNMSIATQNDKLIDALTAFDEIINDMPRSESALDLAKKNLESRIRTERILNTSIPLNYLAGKRLGYDYDRRRDVFDALESTDFDTLEKFQKENVKGRVYNYGILAKPENIDIEALKKLGKVVILTTEDIFGY